jgi:precorrin-6B methylase 2
MRWSVLCRLEIPYLPTPEDVALRMLELAKPLRGELLVDLGCGDGRILILASRLYGCRCVGYEVDDNLIREALRNIRGMGIRNVRVLRRDLFKADISEADILTLYLTPKALEVLSGRIVREMRDGARIVSHDYEVPGLKPLMVDYVETHGIHTHKIYLYKIPDSIVSYG